MLPLAKSRVEGRFHTASYVVVDSLADFGTNTGPVCFPVSIATVFGSRSRTATADFGLLIRTSFSEA